MCKFFSFISDGKGNVFYFNKEQRQDNGLNNRYILDSHSSISEYYFKSPKADDKVNKWEYSNGKLICDQINTKNDLLQVKKWIKRFVKTKEFYDICLETVKQYGCAVRFIKNQTPELCLEAVKQTGWALEYIKNQTPELCLEAVKQNGGSLCYVENQTTKICIEAVKQNGWSLCYVKNQTTKICIEAVKQTKKTISFIRDEKLLNAVKKRLFKEVEK